MQQVEVIDTRPAWMIKEDKQHKCMFGCRDYGFCTLRDGEQCRKLGGKVIPKIRRRDIA